MRKQKRIYGKLLLCMIGLFVLILIAGTYIVTQSILSPAGEYITCIEAQNEIDAFLSIHPEMGEGIKISQDENQQYVQFKDAEKTAAFFEIQKLPFIHKYAETSNVLLSDWELYLDELIEEYGTSSENSVMRKSLYIYAGDEQACSEDGMVLSKDELLTNEGIFQDLSGRGKQFFYTETECVVFGKTILAVSRTVKEEVTCKNTYITKNDDNLTFFWNHYEISLTPKNKLSQQIAGQIADITIQKSGNVTYKLKEKYVNGKVLRISEQSIEIEGYGVLACAEDMAVYRLYGRMKSLDASEIRIGYSFTDFVIEDGKIEACLLMKDEAMDTIRVLIKNSDYEGKYHEKIELSCDSSYTMTYFKDGREEKTEAKTAEEQTEISMDEIDDQNSRICIRPDVLSGKITLQNVKRAQGAPSYTGTIEVEKGEEGLLVINEVLLEEYLYHVVPSEMPSSYPMAALMAQAVCARTYAYGKMLHAGLPQFGAHVDDSAGFQVYNNIKEQSETTKAVKETIGEVLWYGEEPIGAYYYSTSCGVGTDTNIWKGYDNEVPDYICPVELAPDRNEEIVEQLKEEEAFETFILKKQDNEFEREEGWYRWQYEVKAINQDTLLSVLNKRYENNPELILTKNSAGEFERKKITAIGKIKDISVVKRNAGGICDELLINGEKACIKVISELNIRYVLCSGIDKVKRQSGDFVDASNTLPSAFFSLSTRKEDGYVIGYSLAGGGFGHGVGMSQNGAKNMALAGMNSGDILSFFYENSEIKTIRPKGE